MALSDINSHLGTAINSMVDLPKQNALNLSEVPKPTLHNYLPQGNEALHQHLLGLAGKVRNSALPAHERMIHLWGASGSGKSHLLFAYSKEAPEQNGIFLSPTSSDMAWQQAIQGLEEARLSCVVCDDTQLLNTDQQAWLFRIHNLIKDQNQSVLLTASDQAPTYLDIREDLRTRLGWACVYRVKELSDPEKVLAIEQAALARGMNLSGDVAPWLLHHFHRDMPSLMSLIEALDIYSLETKRAVTLPLVKQLLQEKSG